MTGEPTNRRSYQTRLHGRQLALARLLWLTTALGTISVFLVGFIARYQELKQVCYDTSGECERFMRLTPEGVLNLQQIGLTAHVYALYVTLMIVLFYLVSWCIAGLVFWKRSDNWAALLVGMFLLAFGDSSPLAALSLQYPAWVLPTTLVQLLNGVSAVVFYVFPNGQFVPRWTRWMAVVWCLYISTSTLFPDSIVDIETWPAWLFVPLWICLMFSFVVAQSVRYRRVSTFHERQQTKWVVLGFAGSITAFFAFVMLGVAIPSLQQSGSVLSLISHTVYVLILLFIPVSFGIAILRYRLYDIDVIIRRTLIYGFLSTLLLLFYFGSIIVLQALLGPVVGNEAELITVISTLSIAALFGPMRRSIQSIIDRRFYRRNYNAARTLEAFGTRLRDETGLSVLTDDILTVVHDTLQPQHASVWIKQKQ